MAGPVFSGPASETICIVSVAPKAASVDGLQLPVARNNVEESQGTILAFREKLSLITVIRPWREFIAPGAESWIEVKERAALNLAHYQGNYAALLLVEVAFTIMTYPGINTLSCIIFLVVLIAVWAKFLAMNSNPDWQLGIGSFQPSKTQRFMIMVVLTAMVLLSVMGPVLLFDFPFSAVLVLGHAVLHPVPAVLDVPQTADVPDRKSSQSQSDQVCLAP